MRLECGLGGFLLGSALRGKPWLAGKLEETGLKTSKPLMQEASVVLGGMFLLHGILLAVMAFLAGGVRTIPAVVAFVVLYIIALVLLRRRGRARAVQNAPRLVQTEEGRFRLMKGDLPHAEFSLDPTPRPAVYDLILEEGIAPHLVLEALESVLASAGAPSITIREWPGDTLTLEMAGYITGPAGWIKPLRRRGTR